MKKSSYLLLVGAVIGLNLVSFTSFATAVKKDPYAGYDHRIMVWDESSWTFSEDDTSFVAYGWVITQEEFDNGMNVRPHVDYYIDGVKIDVKHFAQKMHDIPEYHSPIFMTYALFDAYHFTPGEHTFYCIVYTHKMVYNEFDHPFYVLSAIPPL